MTRQEFPAESQLCFEAIGDDVRYLATIEPGSERVAFGVVVPDLPGCFSAGDSLDEAVSGAAEAVAAWIDTALDAGEAIPAPSNLETWRQSPDYAGWIFRIVQMEPTHSMKRSGG
jgi:predicted RNase H-like HicB family nuclease